MNPFQPSGLPFEPETDNCMLPVSNRPLIHIKIKAHRLGLLLSFLD